MAISTNDTIIIIEQLREIFPDEDPEFADPQDDGGVKSITLVVPAVNAQQYGLLRELTDYVKSSFGILHTMEGIKLCFF